VRNSDRANADHDVNHVRLHLAVRDAPVDAEGGCDLGDGEERLHETALAGSWP
jgi:hypothetical protein